MNPLSILMPEATPAKGALAVAGAPSEKGADNEFGALFAAQETPVDGGEVASSQDGTPRIPSFAFLDLKVEADAERNPEIDIRTADLPVAVPFAATEAAPSAPTRQLVSLAETAPTLLQGANGDTPGVNVPIRSEASSANLQTIMPPRALVPGSVEIPGSAIQSSDPDGGAPRAPGQEVPAATSDKSQTLLAQTGLAASQTKDADASAPPDAQIPVEKAGRKGTGARDAPEAAPSKIAQAPASDLRAEPADLSTKGEASNGRQSTASPDPRAPEPAVRTQAGRLGPSIEISGTPAAQPVGQEEPEAPPSAPLRQVEPKETSVRLPAAGTTAPASVSLAKAEAALAPATEAAPEPLNVVPEAEVPADTPPQIRESTKPSAAQAAALPPRTVVPAADRPVEVRDASAERDRTASDAARQQTPPPAPVQATTPPSAQVTVMAAFAAAPLEERSADRHANTLDADLFGQGAEAFLAETRGGDPIARGATHSPHALPELPRPTLAQIVEAMRSGASTIDVTLSPEELGRVTLNLTTHDGVLSVIVQAERPETADLIRRSLDLLLAEAKTAGFDDVSFGFGGSGKGGGFAGEERHRAPESVPTAARTPQAPTLEHRPAPPTATGLDLRL